MALVLFIPLTITSAKCSASSEFNPQTAIAEVMTSTVDSKEEPVAIARLEVVSNTLLISLALKPA